MQDHTDCFLRRAGIRRRARCRRRGRSSTGRRRGRCRRRGRSRTGGGRRGRSAYCVRPPLDYIGCCCVRQHETPLLRVVGRLDYIGCCCVRQHETLRVIGRAVECHRCVFTVMRTALIPAAGAMQLPSSVAERGTAHGERTHVRFVFDLEQPLTRTGPDLGPVHI